MKDVGLYRVSAAKSEILQLKEYFDSNHPDLIRKLAQADVHTITGVLKKFLMELPEPLIPEPYSTRLAELKLTQIFDQKEKDVAIIQSLLGLPKANQGSLYSLHYHFNSVARVKAYNKMDIDNLATVFGPTVLSSGSGLTTIDAVQINGAILQSILNMGQPFPSYEDHPLDGTKPQNPITPSRVPTVAPATLPSANNVTSPHRNVSARNAPIPAPRKGKNI